MHDPIDRPCDPECECLPCSVVSAYFTAKTTVDFSLLDRPLFLGEDDHDPRSEYFLWPDGDLTRRERP